MDSLSVRLETHAASILNPVTYNLLMSAATEIKQQALEIEQLKRKYEDDNGK